MTMVPASTGRSAMICERRQAVLGMLVGWALLAPSGLAAAAERPPEPPPAAQAAHQVVYPDGLRARLLRDEASSVRTLDPAIFTELSPVTAAEPAVRLPDDQRERGWRENDGNPGGTP